MSNKNYSWADICPTLLQAKDQREQTKLYNTLKPFFLKFLQNNEELFNDFVLKILDNIHGYDPQYKFSTWIYTIAENMSTNNKQKKKVEQKNFSRLQLEYTNPEESFSLEIKQQFETVFGELSEKKQAFVEEYINNKAVFTKKRNKFKDILNELKQIKAAKFAA